MNIRFLIVVFLVLIVLAFVLPFSLAIILTLIGAAFYYFKFNNKIKEDEILQEVEEEVKAITVDEEAIESIITLEKEIALLDDPLEKDVKNIVNNICDNLVEIVPIMNEQFSSNSITYEVTIMAIEHFPNRIKSYFKLSIKDRDIQKKRLLGDLDNMTNVIDKVNNIIRADNLSKDERESLLSDIKYSSI